ncbi:glycosyltransferase, group 1 family protein [Phocaeicola plebeius DSM 17135]|uniref:Glycosyltransferase, group 1 family protein n=1 Tax=Phocaeicola plebeius (strain DSM 17135 / JCM 12973 / CCUG 54634 / M2) TaxID=484018 RepID=B5CWS2_PHOPM|nr:glycosyltransferase family 1 protein [Phocaeicola plebeius]EDY96719.1 glycosyltransferase, group 1 family protein [Phocaeicola plebeius DSM 17135]
MEKRVLHITEKLQAAGIESFIMNMYRNINRKNVQFDFYVTRNENEFYDKEINQLGGKKFTSSIKNKSIILKIIIESFYLYHFLRKHKYSIVHLHTCTPLRILYLLAAKFAGVNTRIIHSHSAAISEKSKLKYFIYSLFRLLIKHSANYYFACSEAAAQWMYNRSILQDKHYQVIYNGINTQDFAFDNITRSTYRKALNIEDKFVICHTGRFLEQKNQSFLVELMEELIKIDNNVILLLIGTGYMEEQIKNMIKNKHLEKYIHCLGVRSDVSQLLQAADCYVMPSLYEGLPVAAVEAICAGLPCILSENITKEVDICNNIPFISLNASKETWIAAIIKAKEWKRQDISVKVKEAGYDVHDVANKLEQFYCLH